MTKPNNYKTLDEFITSIKDYEMYSKKISKIRFGLTEVKTLITKGEFRRATGHLYDVKNEVEKMLDVLTCLRLLEVNLAACKKHKTDATKGEKPIGETQPEDDENIIEYRPLYRPDGKLWIPNPDRFLYKICGSIAFTYYGTKYRGTKYYIENSGTKERDIVMMFHDEPSYDDIDYKWQATSRVIAGNTYQPIYFDDKGEELAGFAKTYGLAMTPEQEAYYEPIIEKEWAKKNKGE